MTHETKRETREWFTLAEEDGVTATINGVHHLVQAFTTEETVSLWLTPQQFRRLHLRMSEELERVDAQEMPKLEVAR